MRLGNRMLFPVLLLLGKAVHSASTVFGSDLGLPQSASAGATLLDPKAVARWAPALRDMALVDGEQQLEMPILRPDSIDPRLLMVCDSLLSVDDIYTGLMSVMARVEDAWRTANCGASTVAVHSMPVIVHTLLGRLEALDVKALRSHPILGTYVETMAAKAADLISKAGQCQLDYVLLTKVVRMTLKLLADRVACAQIQADVLRSKAGLATAYGSALRSQSQPPLPDTIGLGYDNGSSQPAATGPSAAPYDYVRSSTSAGSPAPNKWPFWPAGYAPASRLQGAVSSTGAPYNGVSNASCPDCAKAVDVISSTNSTVPVQWE